MPINAPQEYYELELKLSKEKNLEEKQRILREMMRVLPKHKGTDKAFAFLKRRMSLLKKEANSLPSVHKTISIRKRWPRICLVGYNPTDILKEFKLTKVSNIYHGMVLVNNVKVQVILVPGVDRYKEFVNSSEIIMSMVPIENLRSFHVVMEKPDLGLAAREFGIIGVYTEKTSDAMAMHKGDTINDLARKIGIKTKKNTYAVVYGNNLKFQGQRVGLSYKLSDGDRVFIKT